MASIRKRIRTTPKGEEKVAWVADYFDQHRTRHLKTFPTRKAAAAWLIETQGEVVRGVHTPGRHLQVQERLPERADQPVETRLGQHARPGRDKGIRV